MYIWYSKKEAIARRKEAIEIVKRTSKRYNYLLSLANSLCLMNLSPIYKITQDVKSSYRLKNLNIDKQMINLMAEDSDLLKIVSDSAHHAKRYIEYQKGCLSAPALRQANEMLGIGTTYELYSECEKELINDLETRIAIPKFYVRFQYETPKEGYIRYKDALFTLKEMLAYHKQMKDIENYKQSAQYQRSKMSSSLRYEIMKRDNFRCVLCGRGAEDGVKLHIDHIVPVSRGGKTEWNNLRTLCQDCNLGKRDKLEGTSINLSLQKNELSDYEALL